MVAALEVSHWASLSVGVVSAGLLYWGQLPRDEHMKACVAAYGTLVGICRLRRGFYFPKGVLD